MHTPGPSVPLPHEQPPLPPPSTNRCISVSFTVENDAVAGDGGLVASMVRPKAVPQARRPTSTSCAWPRLRRSSDSCDELIAMPLASCETLPNVPERMMQLFSVLVSAVFRRSTLPSGENPAARQKWM